jgi:hypothetical protein
MSVVVSLSSAFLKKHQNALTVTIHLPQLCLNSADLPMFCSLFTRFSPRISRGWVMRPPLLSRSMLMHCVLFPFRSPVQLPNVERVARPEICDSVIPIFPVAVTLLGSTDLIPGDRITAA